MDYEFLILHEINLKIRVGKCQVLSVAMNKRVLGFTFTLSYEYLWENLPARKRGFINHIQRKRERDKITEFEKEQKNFLVTSPCGYS